MLVIPWKYIVPLPPLEAVNVTEAAQVFPPPLTVTAVGAAFTVNVGLLGVVPPAAVTETRFVPVAAGVDSLKTLDMDLYKVAEVFFG